MNWEIGGPAGAGQQVTGMILAKACMRAGFFVYDGSEYPSLIRGGMVTYQLTLSEKPVQAIYQPTHLLIALSREAFEYSSPDVVKGGLIIYDRDRFELSPGQGRNKTVHGISLTALTKEAGVPAIAGNMITLGMTAALISHNLPVIEEVIRETFASKGENVVDANLTAVRFGFQYAQKNLHPDTYPFFFDSWKPDHSRMLVTANEMVALAAVEAGCQYYAGYPMTPSSTILHTVTEWAPKTGMLVVQPEDEIAVVHHAIGASYAGVRSMAATSGGGFALMNEAVSLAAMTETPLVIVESQRPGPATGLPTWTEQGDLLYVCHSGHGEFARVVFAPGDPEEAFTQTVQAFDLAEKYQITVFVLLDKYLSEGHKAVSIPLFGHIANRGKRMTNAQLAKQKQFLRYQFVADGVAPRSVPGQPGGIFLANSDEHDERGFEIEGFSADTRVKRVQQRLKKIPQILRELPRPKFYGPRGAKLTLIGWGSVKGPVLEALSELPDVNYLHVPAPFPLSEKQLRASVAGVRKLVGIENNATGQFARLLRQETGITVAESILKYNGSQFYPHEIIESISRLLRNTK